MPSIVSVVPAADSDTALAHFQRGLALETDCWDVHACISDGSRDFVVLDVRGGAAYARGHVTGAVDLAHRDISESTLAGFPPETLFVVYCAGPHCNGADRAAIRLASLDRPVKKMLGGITGWLDEGFPLVSGATTSTAGV